MKPIDPDTVKRALSAHASIGLLASALLYIVCLTGTLVMFKDELKQVEQPGTPRVTTIAPEAVQAALVSVLESERGKTPTGSVAIDLPTDSMPRVRIATDHQSVLADANGRIVGQQESGWTEFVVLLHYTLNIPALGIVIVGLLGVAMLALSMTGLLAHPRLFRDAFRLRARNPGGVGITDWHNRLSVWTLPFGIAIALTGAVIALGTQAADSIAARTTGGDTELVFEPLFGVQPRENKQPAPMADVGAALREMAVRFPQVHPFTINFFAPGTAGQNIQVIARHDYRIVYGDQYDFIGKGQYLRKSGLTDGAIGQQVIGSNYWLHFGHFDGLAVRIAYFLFGLALTAVVATGAFIWLGKRRRRGIAEPRLHAAWHGVVWGTPAALLFSFLARLAIGNEAPFAAIFWIGLAVAVAAAISVAGRASPSAR